MKNVNYMVLLFSPVKRERGRPRNTLEEVVKEFMVNNVS